MSFPKPEVGLVIRYAYLWRHEATRGADEARKDRPCAIVLAYTNADLNIETVVAPITHTKPDPSRSCVEIPKKVKARLGLDSERSWIITDDLNAFIWPGPDIRPIPNENGKFVYGFLPAALTNQVLEQIRTHIRGKRLKPTKRTE